MFGIFLRYQPWTTVFCVKNKLNKPQLLESTFKWASTFWGICISHEWKGLSAPGLSLQCLPITKHDQRAPVPIHQDAHVFPTNDKSQPLIRENGESEKRGYPFFKFGESEWRPCCPANPEPTQTGADQWKTSNRANCTHTAASTSSEHSSDSYQTHKTQLFSQKF